MGLEVQCTMSPSPSPYYYCHQSVSSSFTWERKARHRFVCNMCNPGQYPFSPSPSLPIVPHSWCSDGSLLATGSRDGVCKVWAVSDDITDGADATEGELHSFLASYFLFSLSWDFPPHCLSLSTLSRHQLTLTLSFSNSH
jgi:hypothetical protein